MHSTMSYQGSPYSGPDDFDEDYEDVDELRTPRDDSDEDTEEASETDAANNDEPTELKEQQFQDKLEYQKKLLQQLEDGTHPEFVRRVKRLEHQMHERLRANKIEKDRMYDVIEREYIAEKKAAAKEFEEKKIELKENLLNDFEDKRKLIESERHSMELNSDSMEVKPVMKRILRRRANEPAPAPEKRRKPLTTALTFQLDEREIEADLRAIARTSPPHINTLPRKHYNSTCESDLRASDIDGFGETRVEDGKLLHERRWYHRGQSVFVEGRDMPRFPAHIHAITEDTIWVKKLNLDKMRIFVSHLARGKVTLKRRAP